MTQATPFLMFQGPEKDPRKSSGKGDSGKGDRFIFPTLISADVRATVHS